MEERTVKFTEPQKQAITSRGKTLLVSAGAGSGKTSVLTERIVQKIIAKNNPCDITDFLIVTFTKASAADLKSKIAKAINRRLSDDFGNVHLKRQQLMLGRANISTIHSFYLELIQNNFEKLGLPAKFRLADDNEISVIRRQILDRLLEEYYSSDSELYKTATFSCQDFILAIENFITSRDDANIYNVVLTIYNKLSSVVNKFEIFEKQIAMIGEIEQADGSQSSFFDLEFGKTLKELFAENIDECINELAELLVIAESGDEKLSKKYSPTLSNKLAYFTELKKLTDGGGSYDNLAELCQNYKKINVGSHKISNAELKDYINDRNARILKKINSINKYFEYNFSDIQRFAKKYKIVVTIIQDFITRFEKLLLAEKTRLRTFEFSDLEYFAFKLLIEKIGDDGKIYETDTARQLKSRFQEIFIDEYQDTNKLQDTIFKAISTESTGQNSDYAYGNRFMVGDIKQSIYAFRGAKSDIFAFYAKLFGEFPASSAMPQKIYMKDNFRSSYNIISFINYIFSGLFSEKLGGVNYTGGEVLSYGCGSVDDISIDIENAESIDTTFALIEKNRSENEDTESAEDESTTDNEDNIDTDSAGDILLETPSLNVSNTVQSTEAEYVALKIKDLLDHGTLKNGEKILPRDITILMRNTTESSVFAEALKKYGVPSHTDKAKGFLESPEILLMVSLLKTIDNPHNDIPLAAVMKSPVFGFTLDDLVYLKIFCRENIDDMAKKENLYYYLKTFAESEPEDIQNIEANAPYAQTDILQGKCHRFFEKLRVWRMKSRTMTVDKFVWYLYRQTDIFVKISGNSFSDERRGNLLLLHEYARQFEATSFSGLYGFLNYLDDVKSGEDDFEKAKITSENSNVIRIMSIHKSKGLEFPVCILANTGKRFHNGDYIADPIINEDCGIYFKLRCDDGIGFEKTVFKKVAGDKIKAEMLSEEARILYVALTRAMEKLIVVGSAKNIYGFLDKYTFDDTDAFKQSVLFADADCTLKWLVPIILNRNGKSKTDININVDIVDSEKLDNMIAARAGGVECDIEVKDNECGTSKLSEVETLTKEETETVDEYVKTIHRMYDYEYKHEFLSKVPVKLSISNLHPGILDNDEYVQPTANIELAPLPRFINDDDGANAVSIVENAALTGTAMHLFMQFADFGNAEKSGAEFEANRLLSGGFISNAQYSRLNFNRLGKFFRSEIYQKIKSAKNVYREMRFGLKIPATEFSETGKITDTDEYILIQGVIDLFFIDKNGNITVLDFKTDYVKKDGGEEILIKRHSQQLKYYRRAAEEMLNKPVSNTFIYSFSLGKEVAVI